MKYVAGILLLSVFTSQVRSQNICMDCTATYEFHDAVAPMDYHRSYTITVSDRTVSLVIYTGADTLVNESCKSRLGIHEFLWKLKSCELKTKPGKPNVPCNGGTSESFYCSARFNREEAPNSVYRLKINGTSYHCGGYEYATIVGNVAQAASLFKSMFPDVEKRVAETIVN